MFSRPSHRRRSNTETVQLNLVPMLDAMVTMISFLLFTMSFLQLVSIDSPVPRASTTELEKQLAEKPVQLTLSLRKEESELWSPFERVPTVTIKNAEPGKPDIRAIHDALVKIKQQFPKEIRLILVPYATIPYDILIALMDNSRTLETTDGAVFLKNEQTGVDETVKVLFPELIFGNLLGDNE